MNKSEFLHRFQLRSLDQSIHQYRYHSALKTAAVLIPIIEGTTKNNLPQLQVLLTKRASHLKHHGGQISFPGGKAEAFDHDIIATAIRESEEEIGLHANNINIIGQLHPYQTISGYIVTPIVAFVKKPQLYTIDENEVTEVFHVPLNHFLNTSNHHFISIMHQNSQHRVHFMPYQHYNIWGATAAMLKDLSILLN